MNVNEYLRKYFIYNKDGTFTRLDRKNSNGSYDKDGYLIIKIKGKQYKAHRLVYLYHYGVLPELEIDHINNIRNDNRIENLRLADRFINTNNTVKRKQSRTGIYEDKTKGLKKRYTVKTKNKTYRFYSINEAKEFRENYDNEIQRKIIKRSKELNSTKRTI